MPRSASVLATIVESEPVADFGFPNLRRDHPLAIRTASLPPTRPVINRPRIRIVQSLKPAFAMLFDKEPHLLNRLSNLGRFRAAAPIDPLCKSPCRCFARLACLPRDKF